jgi:uncharacterized protein
MKIRISEITAGGVTLKEELDPLACDLETELVRYRGPLKIQATVSRITNAVTADLALSASIYLNCSRCLKQFEADFNKVLRLSYSLDKTDLEIDLGQDIRQEVILDYPLKPLCRPDCRGLCPVCGKDSNTDSCDCHKRVKGV